MAEPGGAPLGSPRGSRELMPPASSRRQQLVHALLSEFDRWGYGRVETPLVEYYEVIGRGLTKADRAQCVRFIEASTGAVVALRADVTPQIARMAARRLGGELQADAVHRFCYAADVVRQPSSSGEQTEQHQVGVEMIGDGDAWADVELVTLCDAALRRVGLERFSFDLAHAQLARGAVAALALAAPISAQVFERLARKDRSGTLAVLSAAGVAAERATAIASLCDRVGEPGIVAVAARELAGVLPAATLASLGALLDALAHHDAHLARRLVVDLGEVRGFDYYSGVRLRVWAPGVPRPVVRGGRYDGMLAQYGSGQPATGFAIDLDALEQALALPNVPAPEAATAHLVTVPRGAAPWLRRLAAALAERARSMGQRAWVQRADDVDAAEALALAAGALTLTTMFSEDGARAQLQRRVCEAGRWRVAESWDETP